MLSASLNKDFLSFPGPVDCTSFHNTLQCPYLVLVHIEWFALWTFLTDLLPCSNTLPHRLSIRTGFGRLHDPQWRSLAAGHPLPASREWWGEGCPRRHTGIPWTLPVWAGGIWVRCGLQDLHPCLKTKS